MTAGHGQWIIQLIAIKTHCQQYILHGLMRQLRNGKFSVAEKINHIRCPIQTANGISRIVIAMMESPAVYLERAVQPRSGTAAVINPAGKRPQVLQLLRGVFHHQDACYASGSLCIERVHINSVACRLGIHFVGYRIPAQCPFGFLQLSRLTQHVFHQEISQVQSADTVSVVMNVAPATAISHSLIGDMVIHRQEFLLHLLPELRSCSTVIIGYGNPFHQVEIGTHLYTELGQHILVPIRYNPFVSLGSTYHIDRYACHLPILVGYLIEIIFLADCLHLFVRELAFCIVHVAETLFQQAHLFLLSVTDGSQLDVRLQKRMFIDDQPMAFGVGIYERHLQIGRLLTGIHLGGSNQMIDEKASFCIWGDNTKLVHAFFRSALHIAFIAYPCGTPTFEIDSEREGCAFLAVFQELKFDGRILRLFIVYPHNKCRQK